MSYRRSQEVAGRPLVALVHGLGLPGAMWLDFPAALEQRGYAVVVPDNRGSGQSDAPSPPYSMAQLADDLDAVLAQVQHEWPPVVVALSMGGMVAQHLALRHPRRVAGLVLGGTSCGLPWGRPPSLAALWLMLRAAGRDGQALRTMRESMFHPRSLEQDPDILAGWERVMGNERWRLGGWLGQLAATASHSTGHRLGQIRCPTVVLHGQADSLLHFSNGQILARRIPGAELVLMPQAGHAFPLEQPEVLMQAIDRVVQRVAQAAEQRGARAAEQPLA